MSGQLGRANTLVKDAAVVSQQRFRPFGGPRSWAAEDNTPWQNRGYTGHLHNDEVGLIYMNARYYVPSLGRFASADTIVPNAAAPQAFNRFSYVTNNPLRFVDSTGHCQVITSEADDPECWQAYHDAKGKLGDGFDFLQNWNLTELQKLLFWMNSGVLFTQSQGGLWSSSELTSAITALDSIDNFIGDWSKTEFTLGIGGYSSLVMLMCPKCNSGNSHTYDTRNVITFDNSVPISLLEILHELGHAVDWNLGGGSWWSETNLVGRGWNQNFTSSSCWIFLTCQTQTLTADPNYPFPNRAALDVSKGDFTPQEDFADTFAGLVLNQQGQYPTQFINPILPSRSGAIIAAIR